ncbi:DUF3558 domain-containing protein [Actinomycetospora succinea]|uniref:DUF3558 domain-containing protein n=1 Tax=Actinomycetospora succinea TaxID=663603 RepID=UPI00105E9D19|nr:DUF3558 domain-containing protein [Actinomycetospora succinea]
MAATAMLAVLFIAGCTADAPPPTPTRAPTPDRFGAPVPTRSLDGTALSDRPCNLLAESELQSFGLQARGRLQQLPLGAPACVWEGPGFSREVSAAVIVDRDYLVDTYRTRSTYQVFDAITVGGLPAVAQQTTVEALTCTVTVGIAVGQAVDVTSTEFGTAPAPPCDTARRVAETVVADLPPLQK